MAQDKNGYIPPSVQRAMDQHMQRMPANLQKYQSGNTYIPQKAAQEMASYMKKSMPAHMQEYITPYVHQQTVAGRNSLDPVVPRAVRERAPAPDLMRRDHSAFGEQFNVDVNNSSNSGSLSFSPQYQAHDNAQPAAPQPAPAQSGQNNYDFIFQEQKKPKKSLIPSGGSKTTRIIFAAIGALLLIIALIIGYSFISSSSKSSTQALINIAEEQSEITRVAVIGAQKARDSTAKNLAITTQLAMETSQQQILALLKKQGHKISAKQLLLKQNSNTDAQLNNADINNTFDDTFIQLMNAELNTYRTDVKKAYDTSSSKSEKQILADSYNSINTLLGAQPAQSN